MTNVFLAGLVASLVADERAPTPIAQVERDFGLTPGSLNYGGVPNPGGAFGRSKGWGTKAQQNPAAKREKRRARKAMRKRSRP